MTLDLCVRLCLCGSHSDLCCPQAEARAEFAERSVQKLQKEVDRLEGKGFTDTSSRLTRERVFRRLRLWERMADEWVGVDRWRGSFGVRNPGWGGKPGMIV